MADRMPVGQVWIRVSPDTRGFARETKDQLKRLKSLDRYKVPIEVEINAEKVEEDFARAVGNLQKKAATKDYAVKIRTELDWRQGDYRRQIREQVDKYQELADDRRVEIKTNLDSEAGQASPYSPTISLSVDDGRFERDVKRLMEETKADLKVSLDKKSLREEMREMSNEITDFLGKMTRLKKNRLEIEVETKNLQDAELWLMELQKYYDGAADMMDGARRELDRTSRTYNQIKNQIAQISYAMEKLNLRTEEGAEEYERLAGKLGGLNRQLQVYGEERKRLMAVGRQNYLTIETNMESMREAEERVEQLRERVNEIASEIEVGLDHSSVAAVSAELFALVRPRVITVYTRMVNTAAWQKFWSRASDSASNISQSLGQFAAQIVGLRLLYKTVGDLVRIVPKLDMMIPALAGGSVAAVAAISGASTLLGSVLTIGGDMMNVFNMVLALPAALAGAVGSVLILGRAFQDFEERFPEIISYWKDLGDTVSDRVWDRAADNVRDLHKAITPILNAGVPAWAEAWGDSLGAFADGIRDAVEDGHLKEFLDNSIEGTKAAEAGWDSLGSALMRMIGIGSRFFPQMGDWFSDTMQSFEDWVKENDKNGNFERWIREGIKAFEDLGTVIWSTGSILSSLASAARAAGIPGLTEFADAMSSFADKMSRKDVQDAISGPLENMVGFVRTLSRALPELETAVGNLWELFGFGALELAEPITGAIEAILRAFNSPDFQEGIRSFIEDIGTFIEDITPGLESLVGEFGSMAEIVGTAAKSWGPAFNEMLLLFEDLGEGLHPGLTDFLESTGPDLEKLVRDLRPAVEDFGKALGDLLGDEDFQEFVRYVLDSLGDILVLAIRVGDELMNSFKDFAGWWEEQPEWFKDLSTDLTAIAIALPAIGAGLAMLKGPLKIAAGLFSALRVSVLLLSGALSRLGWALLGLGARGGIGGLLARVLGRTLLVGAGPIGWAALIISLVPADLGAELIDAIVGAIFPDTWISDLTNAIQEELDEQFGNKTLFGIMWEGIKEMAGAENSWGADGMGQFLGGLLKFLLPQIFIVKAIGTAVGEWFAETFRLGTFVPIIRDQLAHFMMRIAGEILGLFDDGWETITKTIEGWEPDGFFGSAAKWIFDKIIRPIIDWLLGGLGIGSGSGSSSGGGGSGAASSLHGALGAGSPFVTTLEGEIKGALDAGWDDLIARIMRWAPTVPFKIIGWLADNLWRWLSGGNFVNSLVGAAGGLLNWGVKAWDESVKPWLETGWKTLKGNVEAWTPVGGLASGVGRMGGLIGGLLGTDPASQEHIKEGFRTIGAGAATFGSKVLAEYTEMGAGTRREIKGLADNTDAEFGRMEQSGASKSSSMSSKVGSNLAGMASGALAKLSGMKSGSSSQFSSMQSTANSKASTMRTQVVAKMAAMKSGATAKAAGMQAAVVAKMAVMQAGVISKIGAMQVGAGAKMVAMQAFISARMISLQVRVVAIAARMGSAYVARMASMMTRAVAMAARLRSGVLRALQFNAAGPGRYVGSTFASGLSSGLSRARSVAYNMRWSVRSALSFSAYGSGRTVGGTFASGIRSRVWAVRSAAYALAAAARRALPRSPAEEGPFSGSGWGGWGEAIGDELAKGLRYAAPEVANEAANLMQGVHDALDTRTEVGLGISTKRLDEAFAGAEVAAAEAREGQVSAADMEGAVANGLARLIEPAGERDLVALVRRANRNGGR